MALRQAATRVLIAQSIRRFDRDFFFSPSAAASLNERRHSVTLAIDKSLAKLATFPLRRSR